MYRRHRSDGPWQSALWLVLAAVQGYLLESSEEDLLSGSELSCFVESDGDLFVLLAF